MRDGFLLVDKAAGMTSHDVVAALRRMTGIKKVGHAGTLDPMATGLLVLGLGRATRLLRFVQEGAKEYVARALFGVATDSLDADGAILEREPMPVDSAEVTAAAQRFVGPIHQVPPMVSARRVGGTRLYELARKGEEVEREARPVTIHALEVIDFAPSDYPEVEFRVRCSKGTYVRTLADDVARALGGRAHLIELRRTGNGSLRVEMAHTLEEIDGAISGGDLAAWMLSLAEGLCDLPAVTVGDELARAIAHGVAVAASGIEGLPGEGPVRILASDGSLLGVYRIEGRKIVAEVVTA